MSAAESIPFDEMALNAAQVGKMLGYTERYVLENVACTPGFPARIKLPVFQRKAHWRAWQIRAWRDANQADQLDHLR